MPLRFLRRASFFGYRLKRELGMPRFLFILLLLVDVLRLCVGLITIAQFPFFKWLAALIALRSRLRERNRSSVLIAETCSLVMVVLAKARLHSLHSVSVLLRLIFQ